MNARSVSMAVNAAEQRRCHNDITEVDEDQMKSYTLPFRVAPADAHMVEIGTSSILGDNERRMPNVAAAAVGVSYTEESFIAANANQNDEETMFDDDITSALLNGINNASNAIQPPNQQLIANNISTNLSGNFTLTPRDAMEHSITATAGDQSRLSSYYGYSGQLSSNSFQNISGCFQPLGLAQSHTNAYLLDTN